MGGWAGRSRQVRPSIGLLAAVIESAIALKPGTPDMQEYEKIPGTLVEDLVVPAGGSWSRRIDKGQVLRIVDLEGKQAVDFLVYNAHDPQDRYAAADTMKINPAGIFLSTGSVLYSVGLTPLLTIVADTCGKHDTIGGCCSAALNTFRYGVGYQPN
jgi:uncharacterized protein YcgI (DUF1989 family)